MARLKISSSLENFKILNFFKIWALRVSYNKYRHIRHDYLSNSKTFQDGNGNGNVEEINSNDFQDGNWESMEMKGRLRTPRR